MKSESLDVLSMNIPVVDSNGQSPWRHNSTVRMKEINLSLRPEKRKIYFDIHAV